MFEFHHERMNDVFEKWHIVGLPFPAAFHHFTGPDEGDFHDHPWGFTSHIIAGGYIEEVMNPTAHGYYRSVIERAAGTVHRVEANHIHRIVALTAPECWTLVLPGHWERQPRFWREIDGFWRSRQWDEREFV